MAIGAYVSGYLTTEMSAPFGLALVCGGLAAGVVGLLVGIPSLRIKKKKKKKKKRGRLSHHHDDGLRRNRPGVLPELRADRRRVGAKRHPCEHHSPIVWIVALLTLFLCFQIRGSRIGRAIEAVREDELAAETIGVNLTRVKVSVFGLGAFIAGIGGGLFAHYATFIDPGQFAFARSAEIFIMVVLGGMGNFLGATLGAIVVTVLPELLRIGDAQEWRMTVFGILLVVIMIVRPWGLLGARR